MQQVRLESVRRKSGGRIHLTPRVPRTGAVTTLCGQTLDAGSFSAVDVPPDCANCIRRSRDQARISGAFFEQEEGSELLRLSLEQARDRAQARKPDLRVLPSPPPDKDKPVVWPAAKPPAEPTPDRLGELVTRGFKASGEGVWRSPMGVVVRMRRHSKEWRFAEVVFEGEVIATRTEAGIKLRAGDVEVVPGDSGFEVRVRKRG